MREGMEQGLEAAVQDLIDFVGDDSKRAGVQDTPKRFVKAWRELTRGYREDPEKILARTFKEDFDEMVSVGPIEFYSVCEHHLLPFHGHAWVSYIPDGKIVGLSKLPRLVLCYANRLQVQERLCQQVADAIMTHLKPRGVGVTMKALHQCQTMRGVRSNGLMTTTVLKGLIKEDGKARREYLETVR